jgi:hypothetical protein
MIVLTTESTFNTEVGSNLNGSSNTGLSAFAKFNLSNSSELEEIQMNRVRNAFDFGINIYISIDSSIVSNNGLDDLRVLFSSTEEVVDIDSGFLVVESSTF